ncbi:MAG: hypothetical protein HWQ44_10750 [Nostoc sp. JL34]|uniref:hypothetical protein n=1 Tax=Nostoc sp. JL34 TaxID=2815397 RepID=UPI001DD97DE8|nr:hypothetical protein [Nostoc sp. JL34]MBN3883435.1 hypothetical protein [Nostoc sp. JL34]
MANEFSIPDMPEPTLNSVAKNTCCCLKKMSWRSWSKQLSKGLNIGEKRAGGAGGDKTPNSCTDAIYRVSIQHY